MHMKQKTVRIKQEVQTLKARLRHMGWSGTDEKTQTCARLRRLKDTELERLSSRDTDIELEP